MAGLVLHDATDLAAAFDAAKGFQSGKIMVFGQSLGGNHGAGPGLLAAMPGLVLTRIGVVLGDLSEARRGVGQERALVGGSRQAPIAAALFVMAATVRRLQCEPRRRSRPCP